MPILIMGAMALGVFGIIGILLFTASMLEHRKKQASGVGLQASGKHASGPDA